VALLVSVLSFSGTDANEWCTCLAGFYEFKLNFAKTCEDTNIPLLNGAINQRFCKTFEDGEIFGESSYRVPVKLTNLTVIEGGGDGYNSIIDIDTENLIDGSTFTYQIEDPTTVAIEIRIVGEDEFGEKITNVNTILFDEIPYACPLHLAIQKEDTIGWLEVVSSNIIGVIAADRVPFRFFPELTFSFSVLPFRLSSFASQVDYGLPPNICVSAAPSSAPSASQNLSTSTVPSEIPSSTPTDLPTDEPSLVPSSPSSEDPSSTPTNHPSETPSSDPSEWYSCADVPNFLSGGKDGRDCTWVAKKPEKRCHLDYNALDNCPSVCSPSCNDNNVCEDDPTFRANGMDNRNCDWIAKKPQTRCIKDEDALHKCPSICSPLCTGICQIDGDYRNKNKSKRDCDWVARKSDSRCHLSNNEPYFKCSGVCNPFCSTD
jgi:hypothetical protein